MPTKRANARSVLQREIAALQRKLAQTNVSGAGAGRRNRRRGRAGAKPAGPAGGGVPAAFVSNPRPNRRMVRGTAPGRIGNGGRILLTRDELLLQVVTTAGKTETVFTRPLVPSAAIMPFLFRLSSCYQRIRWLRASVTWRPACGTNTDGLISYGVAFNGSKSVTSRDLVCALTPVNDHPVWQSSGTSPLVIPADMLMSRKWYALNVTSSDAFDQTIGNFCVGLSHGSESSAHPRGEFWINYTVEMEGTNPA